MTMTMPMPRNPGEAEWLVRSAEEEAARAVRWAAVAQQQAVYYNMLSKAHAADAAGIRALWNLQTVAKPASASISTGDGRSITADAPKAEPEELPKCLSCGKTTRIFHGRPQKFCTVNVDQPYSCSHRYRDRLKYARIKEARRRSKASSVSPVICENVVVEPAAGVDPACLHCGKPTRIWRGKPQKFCSPTAGRRLSKCAADFHDRARRPVSSPRAPRRQRVTKQGSSSLPSGSVLATASARAPGYALLASVTVAVPPHLPEDLRQDIIGETLVLCSQGMEVEQAVKEATKTVRKGGAMLRYAKSIDDCFWLELIPRRLRRGGGWHVDG